MTEITLQGKVMQTGGELPVVGASAPDFSLVNHKLQTVNLSTFEGKVKLLNVVPSLDTPVCAASARRFNEKAAGLKNTVILNISADLPFAQDRFCKQEGLKNIIPLSGFRSSFAIDYGLEMTTGILLGLMARAVLIIDEQNKVRYTQLVSEITAEPDYKEVLETLRQI